jgi:hypothetical protein
MAEFDRAIASAGALEVDVAHLNNIDPRLRQLANAIDEYARASARAAHSVARTGGTSGQSALGNVDHVPDMVRQMASTFEAFDANLAAVATCLQQTGTALSRVADDYRTVDERNRLAWAEIARRIPR